MKDIDYALVEEVRPPIYTAMKYWGKKPHNIWREYIKNYTPKDGLYLDPFAGSAMSAFEAVKAGRKAIAFDLNPLTTFTIEVLCTKFDKKKFEEAVGPIVEAISNDKIYKKYFSTKCRHCGSETAVAQHYKWATKEIYEMGILCDCNLEEKYLSKPNKNDILKAKESEQLELKNWFPDVSFHRSPSFSGSFVRAIGGANFSKIWTRRNLYVLSEIFHRILKTEDNALRLQLLLGFIKTLHLCTRMCVPRREGADRAFSTSWGRSAYICADRQMEMNPLFLFRGSCFGKQSVESSISSVEKYLGKIPRLMYVDKSNKSNRSNTFDIKYGIIDVNKITDYVSENSIDFIMTDPPYGGLVQYFDLSALWLVWLMKADSRYEPRFENEITIKRGIQELPVYQRLFENGLKNLYKVLKPSGKIVFTFHNKDIKIWNAFLKAIMLAGFKIEKVIHQQNRRTGESNVANPYGTSANDFYIRCIKAESVDFKTDEGEFEHFIVQKAISLIAQRNEPTPFQILFNGLLAEMSTAGFDIKDFDKNIESILSKHIGMIFRTTDNTGKAGNYWWFSNPEQYISQPDKMLSERVEETIIAILRRRVSVSLDEVLAEIYIKYPNGLTPDVKSVDKILRRYANRSGGKWTYKGEEMEKEFTKHTEMLAFLAKVGRKVGYRIFIGKREQPESYNAKALAELADITTLDFVTDKLRKARLEMVDMLWIKDGTIDYALEVEHSTNFTSGVQRVSNLDDHTKKLMIIPDERTAEFTALRDPLFVDNFIRYNWKYLSYSDIERLKSLQSITPEDSNTYAKEIKL